MCLSSPLGRFVISRCYLIWKLFLLSFSMLLLLGSLASEHLHFITHWILKNEFSQPGSRIGTQTALKAEQSLPGQLKRATRHKTSLPSKLYLHLSQRFLLFLKKHPSSPCLSSIQSTTPVTAT